MREDLIKLNTIQKVEKLNDIYALGEIGPGNAYHNYIIVKSGSQDASDVVQKITIQCGQRNTEGSVDGMLLSDLLEIARNQLQGFQSGEYATEDNAEALKHIEIALMYLNKRTMDRYERNVLSTYKK